VRAGGAYAPRLSVVIPTRDRHTALVLCLRRLAPGAQSLNADEYEVIIADDGNADATRVMLAVEFPDVVVVSGPRRGPAANRNAGARAAEGGWFVFTDDDTIPDSHWLEQLAAASDGVDVVEGRTTCSARLRSPREHAPINETGGWWWSCNIAIRREAFDRLRGFDERYRIPHMEDVDLRERARALGLTSRFAPLAVVDHPPRRERWGRAWAPIHQAELLHAAIHGEWPSLPRMLFDVARVRARSVARAPFSADGISASLSAMVELTQLLLNWNDWKAEARARAAGST
jgi:GT2 family glycosyltransferase